MTTYRSERQEGGSRAAFPFSTHYINGRQASVSICRSTLEVVVEVEPRLRSGGVAEDQLGEPPRIPLAVDAGDVGRAIGDLRAPHAETDGSDEAHDANEEEEEASFEDDDYEEEPSEKDEDE